MPARREWLALIAAAAVAGCASASAASKTPPAAVKLTTTLNRPAAAPASTQPAISLIIDDLGEQHAAGARALTLPGNVAYAFLPLTPFAQVQAEHAYAHGREVLLHLPLEPMHPTGALMPTRILRNSSYQDLHRRFAQALASVPHARGVNNHQGSLLTQSPAHMAWLMSELQRRGDLYFVDSRTTPRSVAYTTARAHGLAASQRNVFLDAEPSEAAVREQWRRLLRHARRHGTALAIGHPYPVTLKVLESELPRLAAAGVRLVAPSELIRLQHGDRPGPVQLQLAGTLTELTLASRR